MKKIIIVNNNMKVGGVQKSLSNLLWELEKSGKYDTTLALFAPVGDYMNDLPPNTKCIHISSLFRYFGVSQGEMHGVDKIKRGFLAGICRVFCRNASVILMRLSQRKLPDTYDCAIAFLHNGRNRSFFGGVQDFVLHCIDAKKKVTFLHDDYVKCGANHRANNRMMDKFEKIAACSDGCRGVFEAVVPELAYKSVTVRNCNNVEEIKRLGNIDSIIYDTSTINIVCAARMSPRKGIDRAIMAVKKCLNNNIPVTLHILGSGVMEKSLKQMVIDNNLEKSVIFHGEQSNPYRYIKNADLFLVSSFHEAAPMVIDESCILGVPILTTRTNSSDEMVTARGCGWVCENSQEALDDKLFEILSNREMLAEMKLRMAEMVFDNSLALTQFHSLLET